MPKLSFFRKRCHHILFGIIYQYYREISNGNTRKSVSFVYFLLAFSVFLSDIRESEQSGVLLRNRHKSALTEKQQTFPGLPAGVRRDGVGVLCTARVL